MYQTIVREEIMKNATPQTQNHIVLKAMNGDELGTLMYAKSYNAETKQLSMITVQQFGRRWQTTAKLKMLTLLSGMVNIG